LIGAEEILKLIMPLGPLPEGSNEGDILVYLNLQGRGGPAEGSGPDISVEKKDQTLLISTKKDQLLRGGLQFLHGS
jgi:hypothetical protein